METNERQQRKYRLSLERRPVGLTYVPCELCHRARSTDLHELINRPHYRPEVVNKLPDELLALLCNHCNVTKADGKEARTQLILQNIDRYGLDRFKAALEYLETLSRGFNSDQKFATYTIPLD